MRKDCFFLAIGIVLSAFCTPIKGGTNASESAAQPPAAVTTAAKKEIVALVKKATERWNAHDLLGFFEVCCWKNQNYVEFDEEGIHRGWYSILSNYQKGFSNPADMGTINIDIIDIEVFKPDAAFAYLRTTIYQPNGRNIATNSFDTLQKFPDGWKVIGCQDASVSP
jgi:uncharacterized protein (TIGR02246 family)